MQNSTQVSFYDYLRQQLDPLYPPIADPHDPTFDLNSPFRVDNGEDMDGFAVAYYLNLNAAIGLRINKADPTTTLLNLKHFAEIPVWLQNHITAYQALYPGHGINIQLKSG